MNSRGFEVVSKYLNSNILIPERKTKGSAGYDISCAQDMSIKPQSFAFVPTGIKSYMLEDEVLQVYPRSSLSFKKQLVLLNSVGIIDSDYYNNPDNEGEIMLIMYNYGNEAINLSKDERIDKGIFNKYLTCSKDTNNAKRLGRLSSTGI